ncbi:MAG: HEAT repeat domain-containing protein [Armatimonadia bacterium]
MPIQVTCQQCGKRYALPNDMAGQTGACSCGASIPIPELPPRRPAVSPLAATSMASLWRSAAAQWPVLRRNALPFLRLTLRRPSVPAALAAWLSSFLLIALHSTVYSSNRWPDSMMPLLADVWLYAAVATLAVILYRRLTPRPVMPVAGLLAGYAIGLLVLVVHGLSVEFRAFHWLAGPFPGYLALRRFTAFLVGVVAGEAAVWDPYQFADPPLLRPTAKRVLTALRPLARIGILVAWLAPTMLVVWLYTRFAALPATPWTIPSQAWAYWLTLLLVPALFGLWAAWQWRRPRRLACAPAFSFVGVQLGLLVALVVWRYPSWQRETAVALSAFLGLLGVGLAVVFVAHPPDVVSGRTRRATATALAAVGLVVCTVVTGFAVRPDLQAMLWRRAAVTTDLDSFATARLAAVHGAKAAPILIATLGDEHQYVREAAAKALAHPGKRSVNALNAMLPQAPVRHRCWAAYFLGESKRPEAVPPLLALLRNQLPPPPPDVELEERQMLQNARGYMPGDLTLKAWEARKRQLPRFRRRYEYSSTMFFPHGMPVEDRAMRAWEREQRELARYHNPPEPRRGLPAEYAFFDYTGESSRVAAVVALAKIDDPAVGPALAAVLDDPALSVRQASLAALATVKYQAAIPALRAILDRASVPERALAAEALAAMGDREIVLPLIRLLQTGDSRAVKAATPALAQTGDKRALQPLAQALARGSDTDGLNMLLTAYQGLGGNTLQPLLAAASNPDPWVRDFAAHKLREQHPAEGVAHFSKLLAIPERAEQAALVLRRMATDEAKAALRARGWPEDW